MSENTTALVVDGKSIRRDGDMWCLTDLWRAVGADRKHQPYEWLRGADAKRFVEFLSTTLDTGNSRLVKSSKKAGAAAGGDTWAHWQLALAYAGWISPAYRARVNEVFKAFKDGQLVPVALPSREREELIRLTLRLKALESGIDSVWDMELKLELARLRKSKWDGTGSAPQPLAFAYGRTWRIILGDVVYDELKHRNPHPRDGSLHAQWLQEQRYQIVKREDLAIALVLARRCTRWSEYETEMRAHFRRAPLQLRLPTQAQTTKNPRRIGR